jgi:hypothetical protein
MEDRELPHQRCLETLAYMRGYMLLMGLAFENLAKAIVVTNEK